MKLRMLTVAIVVAAMAHVAHADEAVVVLVADTRAPLALRVRAELESMGFKVAVRRADATAIPVGAVAVARLIDGRPPRIEIETPGEASSAGTKTVTFDAATDESGVGSVLLAERVRAAFQPLAPRAAPSVSTSTGPAPMAAATTDAPVPSHAAPASSSGTVAPAAPSARAGLAMPISPATVRSRDGVRALAARRTSEPADARAIDDGSRTPLRKPWGFAVAPAFQLGPQAIGAAAYVAFYASPHERLRLEGFVSTPFPFVGGSSVGEAEGSTANVYVGLVGGAATATVWSARIGGVETVSLLAGAGAAGVWLRADGNAAPGYVATTQDAFAALLFGSMALRVQSPWTRRLFFVPRGFLGASVPTIDVEFAGKRVGRWGAPWAMFAGTVEVDVGGS